MKRTKFFKGKIYLDQLVKRPAKKYLKFVHSDCVDYLGYEHAVNYYFWGKLGIYLVEFCITKTESMWRGVFDSQKDYIEYYRNHSNHKINSYNKKKSRSK